MSKRQHEVAIARRSICFYGTGVAMLSSVLNGDRAVAVNIPDHRRGGKTLTGRITTARAQTISNTTI